MLYHEFLNHVCIFLLVQGGFALHGADESENGRPARSGSQNAFLLREGRRGREKGGDGRTTALLKRFFLFCFPTMPSDLNQSYEIITAK